MATQSAELKDIPGRASEPFVNWRACHLFYYGDRTRLIRDFLRPLVETLLCDGTVDRFYFVRYDLGGPHVRFRWRLTDPTLAPRVETTLATGASHFFSEWPSAVVLSEPDIHQTNQVLLRLDPSVRAEDDIIRDDQTLTWPPPLFETNRYGGVDRFDASIDMFHSSSVAVLQLMARHERSAPGWIRTEFLRLGLQLARGLALEDEGLFRELAGYGDRFMGNGFAGVAASGDRIFENKREELMDFVERVLESPDGLYLDARRLAGRLAGLSPDAFWFAATSHIHMTANRIGLTNADEVYLSRILSRALEERASTGDANG